MRSRYKKSNKFNKKSRKKMRGGNGLPYLNPSPINLTNNLSRIPIKNPSPTLARSVPYIPPRPGSPSPPPPLGMTSGPAYGLQISAPPMLLGGSKKKKNCGCSKRMKKSYKKKKRKY